MVVDLVEVADANAAKLQEVDQTKLKLKHAWNLEVLSNLEHLDTLGYNLALFEQFSATAHSL